MYNCNIECVKEFGIDLHISGSLGQGEAFDNYSVEQCLTYLVNNSGCHSHFIRSKQIVHIKENMRGLEKFFY